MTPSPPSSSSFSSSQARIGWAGEVHGPGASSRLYQRARLRTPAGTHSNARIREPHPIFAARATGAYLVDVDGRTWLDCTMGNGSVILGHAHPGVTDAVRRAVAAGLTTGHETADAVAAVELLAEVVPDCGSVRFANTGTEAVMHALAIARHATGRHRVAKAESSYHGWADPVWVSTWPPLAGAGERRRPVAVPSSAGLAPDADQTLVLPFNDPEATESLIDQHAETLGAVIVEPTLIDIGFVPATAEYLQALRRATRRHGIVLVFDELLTGFRLARGGAREHYGIRADLTLFGKAMANGYPVAAVEGEPELMASTDPTRGGQVGWVGTYNGHAIAMAATRASLAALREPEVLEGLRKLTSRLRDGFTELSERYGIPAVLAGNGGHFQPYFRSSPPRDYRDAAESSAARYAVFAAACARNAVLVAEKPLLHCALSAAHTQKDVETLLGVADEAFAAMEAAA